MITRQIAIIGAGISGLACAYHLQERAAAQQIPLELKIFEASGRAGGILQTEKKDGFLLEHGADAFITEKPWALELARKLGLESELTGVQPEHQQSAIVFRGRLWPIPKGFYLIAAPQLKTLWQLPFLSLRGKCRMLLEPWIAPKPAVQADESVAAFMRRRFGEEALWRIGQPMIGGIYTADLEKLSLAATFPQFREMELCDGSVIRGLQRRTAEKEARGPRYRLFQTFKGGMQALTDRLVQVLGPKMEKNKKLTQLEKKANGWQLQFADGSHFEAEAVCLALPVQSAAELLVSAAPAAAGELAGIRTEPALTINLAFRAAEVAGLPRGAGFVIPHIEGYPLVGVTWAHQKFASRAPANGILVRAFAGGAYHRGLLESGDETLVKLTLETLQKILGLTALPLWTKVQRHPQAMPQFEVGHLDRVRRLRSAVEKTPGLFLTGNYLSGVGIPDCVHEAQQTADNILRLFKSLNPAR